MTLETEDLLHIPTFLRVGHPDRDAAQKRGAAILKTLGRSTRVFAPKPDPRKQKPTESQAKALEKIGWKWYHILKINRDEAGFYLEKQFGPEVRFVGKLKTETKEDD